MVPAVSIPVVGGELVVEIVPAFTVGHECDEKAAAGRIPTRVFLITEDMCEAEI